MHVRKFFLRCVRQGNFIAIKLPGFCFDTHSLGIFPHSGTRGNVVGVVTRLRAGRSGVRRPVEQDFFFFSSKCPGSLWGKATGA